MKTHSAYNPKSSTKGYWPLNGNSFDISGNSNTGSDSNTVYLIGKFGKGAFLNNVGNILTPLDISGYSAFTISFWVNEPVLPSGSDPENFDTCIRTKDGGGAGQPNVNIDIFNTGIISAGAYTSSGTFISSINKIKINTWQNIIFTYDGANISLYLDGRFESSTAKTGNIQSNSNGINIGCRIDGGGNKTSFLNGTIDEVIIESRAWTAAEVSTYYRKSMLNYGASKRSLWNILGTAYSLLVTAGSYTLTGNNILFNRAINLITSVGSYTLTGINVTFSRIRQYIMSATTGLYNLIGKAISITGTITWKYPNQTKHTATPTQQTKNTATLTEEQRS